jgi:hypothetical protein
VENRFASAAPGRWYAKGCDAGVCDGICALYGGKRRRLAPRLLYWISGDMAALPSTPLPKNRAIERCMQLRERCGNVPRRTRLRRRRGTACFVSRNGWRYRQQQGVSLRLRWWWLTGWYRLARLAGLPCAYLLACLADAGVAIEHFTGRK